MADKDRGTVRLTWNGEKITQAVKDGAWEGLQRAGVVLQRSMQDTVGVAGGFGNRSSPGEPPRVDSNLLRKSITSNPDKAAQVVRVGTNQPHGRTMEYGAVIRAKKSKFLPVPLNEAGARLLRNAPAGLKKTGRNLQVIRTKTGRVYLVEMTKKSGKIKKNGAKFKLVKSVRILPRPWVTRSLTAAKPKMVFYFETAIKQAIAKAVRA